MKLEIDLSQQTEVEAGIALLEAILGKSETAAPCTVGVAALPTAPEPTPVNFSTPTPPAALLPTAPAPPAMVAPTAPAPSASPASAVELDANNLPWDERIHSSTKSKLANGTWKLKRNVDPGYTQQVMAQLAGGQPAAPSPAAVFGAEPIAAPAPPAQGEGVHFTAHNTVAPSPDVRGTFGADDPSTFEQMMPRVTASITRGLIPPTALHEAAVACGLASIVQLQQNPAMVPLVWAALQAKGAQ